MFETMIVVLIVDLSDAPEATREPKTKNRP